jgi:hypothetical protein
MAYLHDGLKVEGHAIPQSELSTRRACKTSSTLWCPSHDIDRVFDFVQRGMGVFSGYAVSGSV